ncbi:hypothetical protein ACP4OV_001924 [Aristida adscensionis]
MARMHGRVVLYFHATPVHMAATSTGHAGGGGTSTISAVTATGWHVLKVEGYSQTKGVLGVGNSVKSGGFAVGGHGWRIGYDPDGYNDERAGWISLDLFLDRPAGDGDGDGDDEVEIVNAKSTFSLLDDAGDPVPSCTASSGGACAFSAAIPSWGIEAFIERAALEASPHLRDDAFRVRCDVTVVKEIRSSATAPAPPPPANQHAGGCADEDVTFEVGGEVFRASSRVLAARSPVFRAELAVPGTAPPARVLVDNMEAGVFKALLDFIYTDAVLPEVDDDGGKKEMAQRLLVAADKYGMMELKSICEAMLLAYVDADTAASILAVAERHGCHGLKEACFEFLRIPSNLRAAMATDGFARLMGSSPSVVKELISTSIADRS